MEKKNAILFLEKVLRTKHLEKYVRLLEISSGRKDCERGLVDAMFQRSEEMLKNFGLDPKAPPKKIFQALQQGVSLFNDKLYNYFQRPTLSTVGSWSKVFHNVISSIPKDVRFGWFLREDVVGELLRKHPPKNILKHLHYSTVDAMLSKEDIFEIMSSLRFGETKDWMREFFSEYKYITPHDFTRRNVECRVLDPRKWGILAQKFSSKKLHTLSHLKEFGVIFFVPQKSDSEERVSSFIKVLGLFLHYIFEIHFYSQFFQRYAARLENFSSSFVQCLAGDIPNTLPGEFQVRIIHQYHLKLKNPDKRAFEPHVHPEALHWQHSLSLMTSWVQSVSKDHSMPLWRQVDHVFMNFHNVMLSMNFSDLAIDQKKVKIYHGFESLWNEIFILHYSHDTLEKNILQNLDKGFIDLQKIF